MVFLDALVAGVPIASMIVKTRFPFDFPLLSGMIDVEAHVACMHVVGCQNRSL